ncbi:hypothetical protein FV139_12660 [Parahaliea maris]|uniref:Uncharacterized protein n=1 Tax=Parahaliea maris TaxID=2716870 RepID=A0A5C8ZW81_9GAMM|nr:hypothetical protein [Parahaliea maris]TXS92815.1 hypothetical protein FV139_12660 [Parahaliea maris]
MLRLLPLIAVVAIGYWYYTNHMQPRSLSPTDQARENARLMEGCIRNETRSAGVAGMAGLASDAGDVESECADKLGLQMDEGTWQRK